MNFVALSGYVKNIKRSQQSGNTVFQLAVSKGKDKNGEAVIETSWHNVVAREGRNLRDLDKICKGSKVYVQGRLRYQKYTGSDGVERLATDIVANRLVILDDESQIQYEM